MDSATQSYVVQLYSLQHFYAKNRSTPQGDFMHRPQLHHWYHPHNSSYSSKNYTNTRHSVTFFHNISKTLKHSKNTYYSTIFINLYKNQAKH
jgi:hypothetical protein